MMLPVKALAPFCAAASCLILLAGPAAGAERVLLRVRAGNPADRPQTVQIRSALPTGISSNDIINLGGLDLVYDVHAGVYSVRKDVQLGPKEVAEFAVEIRDVWQIPVTNIEALTSQAVRLAGKLQGTAFATNGAELANMVTNALSAIRVRQDANEVKPGVPVIAHIRAYEANTDALKFAKRDLGRLETLVIASGSDPEALMGEAERVSRPAFRPANSSTGRLVTIQIRVQNVSTSEVKRIPLRRDLPPEVGVPDVVDAGGLEVGYDQAKGCSYVWRDAVEIDPGAVRVFEVRVRDCWDVNGPRMESLRTLLTDLRRRVKSVPNLPSVAAAIEDAGAELERVAAEEGPPQVSDRYVAFYHQQTERVDAIEDKLSRIDSLLRPVKKTKYGVNVQPPNLKTTWGVIWGIIGFLGVISLLFFLRWYGRSKTERQE
jgi:hypothetical protein